MKPEKLEQIRKAMAGGATLRGAAKAAGVHASTALRALRKAPRKVRKAEEFSGSSKAVQHAQRQQPIGSWSLETIRAARDDQMRGNFKQPVRLAEALRTDDALFVAYHNRLAPHNAIASELQPSDDSTRAVAVRNRAVAGVFLSRTTLEGAVGTLANHGIAVLQIKQVADEEGTRVDFHVEEWPLEHVRWDASREVLETTVKDGGSAVPIVHGDGEWVVIRKFDVLPWTQEACLLPAAMLWAGHAFGLSDWAQSTKSHGQAKMAAHLGEGVALEERDPDTGVTALSPEAEATLRTLQDMVSGDAGAGIFPAGTKVDFLANGSTAWQVFSEFIQNREKGAARVYNGTDATMGSAGGAPGVDISILFGVASTKVQGDLGAVMAAVNSGVYAPWTAINEGDSRYAPRLAYLIPDPDAARKLAEELEKRNAFAAMVKAYKDVGVVVDQDVVDRLAKVCGISPAPVLASGDVKAVPIPLAPTDIAKVVRVGPALRSLGLEPFGDRRDQMTITELDEFVRSQAAAATGPAPAAADARPSALAKFCQRIALAGNFDESKHPRADDGKFGSGGGSGGDGDDPKHKSKGKPKKDPGGSEGDGPKGPGDGPGAGEGSTPEKRVAVAEQRLEGAKKSHDAALAEHAKADERVKKASAEVHAKLDARAQHRAEAAAEAKRYIKEIDDETDALEKESNKLDKEAKKAGVDSDDWDDEDSPHANHPINKRRREVAQRLSELEEAPYEDLKAEARANSKPEKAAAKLRAALDAGDLERVDRYDGELAGGGVEREILDSYGAEHDVRKAYIKEHGSAPDKATLKALAERESERRAAARPNIDTGLSPILGSPAERKEAEAWARELWTRKGFEGEPPADILEANTHRRLVKMGVGWHSESDLYTAAEAREKAAAKAARAARVVRVHEREVIRRKRSKDADGDGRTGDAEERDDKPKPGGS